MIAKGMAAEIRDALAAVGIGNVEDAGAVELRKAVRLLVLDLITTRQERDDASREAWGEAGDVVIGLPKGTDDEGG